jgi:hypothetical protein
MKLIPSLCLVSVSFLLAGCTVNYNLKVTEVWTNRVELYLDEPPDKVLNLHNKRLKWVTQEPGAQPVSGEVNLGLAGSMRGGQFLVIFEDPNYTGAPIAQDFRPSTPGIKVRDNFFPGYGNDTGSSMGVEGEHTGTYILFVPGKLRVKDLVRFGHLPRPTLVGSFGVFRETDSLATVKPTGGQSVSRSFSASRPVDTDSESDWSLKPESIGVANPP